MNLKGVRAAVLTISDSCATGKRKDESGAILSCLLQEAGYDVLEKNILADNKNEIARKLRYLCDKKKFELIMTSGGTGLGPRDFTPEATKAVIQKEVPGLIELMRSRGAIKTKRAYLSRAIAGTRGRALIINLPGSPAGVLESFQAIAEIIPHALAMMKGQGHEKELKVKS